MEEHRITFHHELDAIRDDLVVLTAKVTELIPRGTEILLNGDLAGADEVIRGDDEIDALSLQIEERCLRVLALQQPMASDLRRIVTALRIVSDVERSADLVVNICKAARRLYGIDLGPRLRGLIARLSDESHLLFERALEAFSERNASLAAALDDMDDVLDRVHAEYIRAIFETHSESKLELQTAVQLAMIGRFFERIGDHAVNIGQRVEYMVTGWMPEQTGAARAEVRARMASRRDPAEAPGS